MVGSEDGGWAVRMVGGSEDGRWAVGMVSEDGINTSIFKILWSG